MPPQPRNAKIAYGLLAVTDTVLAGRRSSAARRLRYVTKPLLMPALATAFASSTDGRRDVMRQATLGAHAFSWGGDVALLGKSERAFVTGVGSFLTAHLSYTAGFASRAATLSGPRPTGRNIRGPKAAAAMWAATTPLMTLAAGREDSALRIPVAAYATALVTMFATSTMLDPGLPLNARRKIVLGTSLFLLSDAILGVRKFLLDSHSPAVESAVMATYTAGQWFIADGIAGIGAGTPEA